MNNQSLLENVNENQETKLEKRRRKFNKFIRDAIQTDKETSKKLLQQNEKISTSLTNLTVDKVIPALKLNNFCLFEESPFYIHRVKHLICYFN